MEANALITLMAERYSVRSFKPEPVAEETLALILHAGHLAPTAKNIQPQRILVLSGEEDMARLRPCTKCHFGAPTALLLCYDKEECWKRPYDGKSSGEIDAGIVGTHMILAAKSLGVGSTWVMHFDPVAMRETFAIPENIEPAALLVMGYPADDATPAAFHSAFRPMEETVFYHRF